MLVCWIYGSMLRLGGFPTVHSFHTHMHMQTHTHTHLHSKVSSLIVEFAAVFCFSSLGVIGLVWLFLNSPGHLDTWSY